MSSHHLYLTLPVLLAGCGGSPRIVAPSPVPPAKVATVAKAGPVEIAPPAKVAPTLEPAKVDRSPEAVLDKAIASMKKSAASSFGSDEASRARITADASGIKEFGADAWEVTGQYEGPDKAGKPFKADWTARIEFAFGSLQCMKIKMKDRHYSE